MQRVTRSGTIVAVALAAALAAAGAPAQDPKRLEAGERVYVTYCFTCHGENLVSSGQTFDLRRLKAEERARFENSVMNGKGQMPPWKGVVTEDQLDLLWLYIRANSTAK